MEVIYHVAASLDGYLATSDGGVDWLDPYHATGDDDYGLKEFYASIDALVMGSGTYEFALAHPPWMAPDRPTRVLTRRELPLAHETVQLTDASPRQVLDGLQRAGLRCAWLLGGGKTAASFRDAGLIDRLELATMPILLGDGIPLFAPTSRRDTLELIRSKAHANGVVQRSYAFERTETRTETAVT